MSGILGAETITTRRPAAGTRGSDGRYTRGTFTSGSLRGSVQPLTDDEVELLPEGQRTTKAWCVLTKTEVLITDQDAGTLGDQLYIDGTWFEALHASRERLIIPHYRVIVIALQETGA